MRPRLHRVLLLWALALLPAAARNAEGLLDVILTPNSGVPVIAVPGSNFEVVTSRAAEFSLSGMGGDFPVVVESKQELLAGRIRNQCRLPEAIPVGTYALKAGDDTNQRALFVVAEFPKTYVVAHITDVHIGKNVEPLPLDVAGTMFEQLNQSGAAFVLVTGDVTEGGAVTEFQQFSQVLDTCTLPTFVSPGNHDRNALNYENFFGPLNYAFKFGPDGYLSIDSKDFFTADDLSEQPAESYLLRESLNGVRWVVAFSHRYEPDMGMHTQWALFVDDPVDLYVFGHWHRANTKTERAIPWAGWREPVPMTVTPAAYKGGLRYIDIGSRGAKPRDPETLAQMPARKAKK